jgi:hypothetical protein
MEVGNGVGIGNPEKWGDDAPKRFCRPKALTIYGFILETRLISLCTCRDDTK